jgi:hypothetical protein
MAAFVIHGSAIAQAPLRLAQAADLAGGVRFYRLDETAYLGAGNPISARLVEIATGAARLDLELGKDGKQGRDTVASMAARRSALAAINAGFFGTTGDPAGVLKIDGLLISDTMRPRGAVAFATPDGPPLLFDRVTATARLRARNTNVAVTGVDTTRGQAAVVVYTARYGATTRTAGAGTEWTVEGSPLAVTNILRTPPSAQTSSAIPARGFVISVSGAVPAALARLKRGDRVDLAVDYATVKGPREAWAKADDIVSGAGLLLWRGNDVTDWAEEKLAREGFVDARHPRTLIGRDRDGDTWLVVVDGRQPERSVGMSLPELTDFARRIGLVDALNLDGGGSSTMVVKGEIVNRPSDPLPRPVSDAIVVLSK